jgi:uncharacterized protein with NRDE domain
MCLITLSWQPDSQTPLTVAANRDEFYARPTLALHRWPDQRVLAGQDQKAGGTWLGVGWTDQPGVGTLRFAALTNYRDISQKNSDAPSRGHITAAFLNGSMTAASYLEFLAHKAALHNPFNLIVFDGHALMGFESRHLRAFALPPGISSVSNADFNTPWPKLLQLQEGVRQAVAVPNQDAALDRALFDLLSNHRVASDDDLPQTGLSIERERTLSAAFICTTDYGTRASSVLRLTQQSAVFTERSFDANGFSGEVSEKICLA